MNIWLQSIKEVGFPIIVTMYLLYRVENKLDKIIGSIQDLPNQLHKSI